MTRLKKFLVLLLAIQLGGCAYQPKQVEASRPLVNSAVTMNQTALPQEQQQALNTLPSGASVDTASGTIRLGQRYTSALGRECRELLVDRGQAHAQRNAACRIAEQWYLIPQLEQAPTNSSSQLATPLY